MRDEADHARLALVQHLLPYGRAQAVGANDRRALNGTVVLGAKPHAVAEIFVAGGAGQRHQFDIVLRLAGIEQDAMQIDPMDDDVGTLEPRVNDAPVGMRAMTPASTESSISTAFGMIDCASTASLTPSRSNM